MDEILTVLIPTYNRKQQMQRTLDALSRQLTGTSECLFQTMHRIIPFLMNYYPDIVRTLSGELMCASKR